MGNVRGSGASFQDVSRACLWLAASSLPSEAHSGWLGLGAHHSAEGKREEGFLEPDWANSDPKWGQSE